MGIQIMNLSAIQKVKLCLAVEFFVFEWLLKNVTEFSLIFKQYMNTSLNLVWFSNCIWIPDQDSDICQAVLVMSVKDHLKNHSTKSLVHGCNIRYSDPPLYSGCWVMGGHMFITRVQAMIWIPDISFYCIDKDLKKKGSCPVNRTWPKI